MVSLGGCVAGEAGRLLAPPQHRCWRYSHPLIFPHLQLPVRGELTVSRNNCFALTFKNSVLYAPAGSTVTGDGQGVNIGVRSTGSGTPSP